MKADGGLEPSTVSSMTMPSSSPPLFVSSAGADSGPTSSTSLGFSSLGDPFDLLNELSAESSLNDGLHFTQAAVAQHEPHGHVEIPESL